MVPHFRGVFGLTAQVSRQLKGPIRSLGGSRFQILCSGLRFRVQGLSLSQRRGCRGFVFRGLGFRCLGLGVQSLIRGVGLKGVFRGFELPGVFGGFALGPKCGARLEFYVVRFKMSLS